MRLSHTQKRFILLYVLCDIIFWVNNINIYVSDARLYWVETLDARLNSFSYKLASIWTVKTDWFENFNLLIKLWHKVDKFMPSPPTFIHSITHAISFPFFSLDFRVSRFAEAPFCHGSIYSKAKEKKKPTTAIAKRRPTGVRKIERADDEQKSNNEIQFWPLPQRFAELSNQFFVNN